MRIIAFILSIYILFLTGVPCADGLKEPIAGQVERVAQAHADHQNDIDCCSPFCTCNCCVTPVCCQDFAIDFKCYSIPQLQVYAYLSGFDSYNYASIWQPPKLS
ncbi:MAG: DUF6660 family protein [Bacteroidales bacterium]|nr:hypothetical protein [Bacteroidales bacterium]MEA4840523.1 DUF6660 family protein [Bacteroidales bacterium]